MKEKTVAATYARIHFGEIMRHVVEKGETVVVERSGKPQIVVLSVADYQKLTTRNRREEVQGTLERITDSRTRQHSSLDRETIVEAVKGLRKSRYDHIERLS